MSRGETGAGHQAGAGASVLASPGQGCTQRSRAGAETELLQALQSPPPLSLLSPVSATVGAQL